MKKKKILIYMYSLGGGGVQRFAKNLITNIDQEKYDIKLAVVKKEGIYLSVLENEVEVIDLEANNVSSSLFPLIKTIKRVKPDVILSIDTSINIIAIVAKLFVFPKPKVIIRQAVNINKHSTSFIKRVLLRVLYRFTDRCVVISNDMLENVSNSSGLNKNKMKVIYNAVDVKKIDELRKENVEDFTFPLQTPIVITVGRLTRQKNQELLIEAIEELNKMLKVTLLIIGEGENESYLNNLIKEKKLEDHIKILGFKENPYKYMNKADIFALSSIYEGLSNAMIEAISCNLPIVTTNNPDDLIKNYKNGFYVQGDKNDFANHIYKILTEEKLIEKIKNNNSKYKYTFGLSKLVSQYEQLLDDI